MCVVQLRAPVSVLAAGYRPEDVERDHADVWQIGPASRELPAYSFILPPPNVTGHLHLGHALMCTVQVFRLFVRFDRIQGELVYGGGSAQNIMGMTQYS